MPAPPVTKAEFKTRFKRDFPYDPDEGAGITDADLDTALADAVSQFKSTCWVDEAEKKAAFLLLAAHCLWSNLQAAGGLASEGGGQGLDASGEGVVQSKSAGGASVNFVVPEWVQKDPTLAMMWESKYGRLYLAKLRPRLIGSMFVAGGDEDTLGAYQ